MINDIKEIDGIQTYSNDPKKKPMETWDIIESEKHQKGNK